MCRADASAATTSSTSRLRPTTSLPAALTSAMPYSGLVILFFRLLVRFAHRVLPSFAGTDICASFQLDSARQIRSVMHTYGASRSLFANSTPFWGQRAGESARRDRRGFSSNSLSARNELKGVLPVLPVVVHDHAADVFAVAHCLVADVDVIECVGVGDELVELERAVLVHAKQARDVAARVR